MKIRCKCGNFLDEADENEEVTLDLREKILRWWCSVCKTHYTIKLEGKIKEMVEKAVEKNLEGRRREALKKFHSSESETGK